MVISQQLGHSNLATTNTYLNHLKPADVVAAMQSRPSWVEDQEEPDKVQELMSQSDEQLGALMRQFLQSQK